MRNTGTVAMWVLMFSLTLWSVEVCKATPLGMAFAYQGRLLDANNAADGLYDFEFKLFDAADAGVQQGSTIDVNDVDVIDGYFTVELDFGGVFNGDRRWLEVGVRAGELEDPNAYTALSARQEVTATPYALYAASAAPGHSLAAADGSAMNAVYVDNAGNVGVGTTSPVEKLHVEGGTRVKGDVVVLDAGNNNAVSLQADGLGSAGQISVYDYDGTETVTIAGAETSGEGAEIRLKKADGTMAITLDADYNGDGRVITQELQITGGSDLSEQFDVDSTGHVAEAGMVVSIDPARPGKLQISTMAYDNKVAGIVTGGRGLGSGVLLGAEGYDCNVALAGRVYCNVDATEQAVVPGDLLTTSDMPGYAMKVTDYTRAQGAIIGKAMEPLDRGNIGQILVLVTLQ